MSATANSIGAKREQHEDTSQEQSFHTFNEYPLSVSIDLETEGGKKGSGEYPMQHDIPITYEAIRYDL